MTFHKEHNVGDVVRWADLKDASARDWYQTYGGGPFRVVRRYDGREFTLYDLEDVNDPANFLPGFTGDHFK